MIPILDMYAAYRIRKLRKYLAVMILIIAVPASVASSVFLPTYDEDWASGFTNLMIFYYGVDDNQFAFSVIVQIAAVLFAIFLIRRWSRQWNIMHSSN